MSSSASDLVLLLVPGNTRVLATKVTNKIVKDTQTQQKISHISKVQGGGGGNSEQSGQKQCQPQATYIQYF